MKLGNNELFQYGDIGCEWMNDRDTQQFSGKSRGGGIVGRGEEE